MREHQDRKIDHKIDDGRAQVECLPIQTFCAGNGLVPDGCVRYAGEVLYQHPSDVEENVDGEEDDATPKEAVPPAFWNKDVKPLEYDSRLDRENNARIEVGPHVDDLYVGLNSFR